MITVKHKLKLVKACFGEYKMSSTGNNVSVVCVSCLKKGKHTKKKKLSIDLDKGIYHCWVCEAKGRNVGSFACKHVTQKKAAQELSKCFKTEKEENKVIDEDVVELPEDFRLVFNLKDTPGFRKHYEYLANRGFTRQKMLKFRVGVSDQYEFKDRVIFPSFDLDQNLNYFISRTIDPNVTFRYKNAKSKRKDVIFRRIDLDMTQPLILTEGVFDLVNAPKNSTCMLGSWLREDYMLFQEIVKNRTPVILCLDPDAKSKSIEIAKLLNSYCIDVRLSQHKDRDFGDMTEEEVNYFINTAKPYDNVERIGYLISELRSGSMF